MFLAILRMIRAFSIKIRDDSVSAFSTQAAYFIILSFFPFCIFFLALVRFLPISVEDLRTMSVGMFPDAIDSFIQTILDELFLKPAGALLSVSVIVALWSASRGILAVTRGLNAVYNQKENRNYLLLRLTSAFYTLIFAVLIIITLVLLVFGNQLYGLVMNKFPFLGDLALLLMSLRSLITMAALTLMFVLFYLFLPNRKSSFFQELPGALVSAAGWLGFSYLFSFYIDNFANYSYTYGSLAAIAICMLWIYVCMYIMFVGAEINAVFSHPDVRQATKAFFAYRSAARRQKKENKPRSSSNDTDT